MPSELPSLRAVVIGAGSMGSHHARVLSGMEGIDLVAVVDPRPTAYVRQRPSTCSRLKTVQELRQIAPDIAILATPTTTHAELAIALAEMRLPTLIEKPLSATEEDGARIVDAFQRAGTVGCVGHIERFNGAVREVRSRVQRGHIGPILRLSTVRHCPRPPRVRDVGVILDLATHDLDLGSWLLASRYDALSAACLALDGRHEDLVEILATTRDGAEISHSAGWLSRRKYRHVTVVGTLGLLHANLLTQDVIYERRARHGIPWPDPARPRGDCHGEALPPTLMANEPLRAELEAFRDLVLGRSSDVASLDEGLRVVKLATLAKRNAETLRCN